jgi:hypothetical protein
MLELLNAVPPTNPVCIGTTQQLGAKRASRIYIVEQA